ncbi:O-antigen polymerase [Aquiflexum gelatinilyticum]|uniref:O-antigen polymerase n=1 Tax=Aquiflexum gelatinilyticum TaxID=2961943 RepID=UPI0021697587|nr:O-antigen polymerase [Aquiflexum gelatinilyticum]MCS4433118.1 oligosaccharide repeat unit polymerase [Aquiflexum gelatinilyticum]
MVGTKKILVIVVTFLFALNYIWFGFDAFSGFFLFFIISSVFFNLVTKTNSLFLIIMIYFYLWLLWGNLTYNIFSTIWIIDGDIVMVNNMYSLFIFTFSILGFLFVKNQESLFEKSKFELDWDFSLKKAIFFTKILIGLHLVFFLPNISLGIEENYSDFSQNIALRVPFINRLIYIYPIFLILTYLRFQKNELSLKWLIWNIFISSLVLTLTGSRFLLMTTMICLFFIHIILLKRLEKKLNPKLILYGGIFVGLIYFIVPLLRASTVTESNQTELANEYFVIFTKFGGEFRDGVWSTKALSEASKELISNHYLETVFFPLFPKPLISLLGLDYNIVFEMTSSVIMANSIDVEVKGIRIGGVLELFYWNGYLGVIIGSILLFIISNVAIKQLYGNNSVSSIAMYSYLLILPFYFSFAQSNLLFTPLISFYLLFLIIYFFSKNKNEKSIILDA